MFLPLTAIKILTAAITAVIAIIFLLYGAQLKKTFLGNRNRYSGETPGIVSRQWKKEIPLEKGDVSTVWYIDYKYQVGEDEYEICSDIGHYKKMFEDGRNVTVHYDPQDPKQIYVAEENGTDRTAYRIVYILGYIVIGIGVLLQILLAVILG